MKVAFAGASGLLGTALTQYLTAQGHTVTALQRNPGDAEGGSFLKVTPEYLETFDGVINLAGESIVAKRWTFAQKQLIRDSRTKTTAFLANKLAKTKANPKVFINASAIGFYGDRGEDEMTESSRPGAGFLASVCQNWERAALDAERPGLRIVVARIGVVISKDGGALAKMLVPFKMGAGGILGTGKQYMSWISIHDIVRAFEFLLMVTSVDGPVNLTSPNPVTNKVFTKLLGKALHRPALFPAPALALKLFLGGMAQEMLLEGNRVLPDKLTSSGFRFEYPLLLKAIEKELN
jgi:uncharacterized protein (TIGR01777 family)